LKQSSDRSVADFYDGLAADYHLIFEDWNAAIARQGEAFDRLLRASGVAAGARILDCACGIGTQALGLAARGFRVLGTDVSTQSVARARVEAAARNLHATFAVADMRTLAGVERASFDAAIAADNALPHLLDDAELAAALRAIGACLKHDAAFVATVRDYDALLVERPTSTAPRIHDEGGPHRIVHQVWEWLDADHYRVHLYITLETGAGWTCHHHVSRYRALRRASLDAVLADAGFVDVRWLMPEGCGYYQPVVVARRPPRLLGR
jgi:SAM-dependent methyltransferase